MRLFRKHHNQKGFTLVEIMAVTAIIGMITAMAAPHFLRTRVSANEAAAQANLKTLFDLTEDYRFVNGTYPDLSDEITAFSSANYGSHPIISVPGANGVFTFQGYQVAYSGGAALQNRFNWSAIPSTLSVTSERSFGIDESGELQTILYEDALAMFPIEDLTEQIGTEVINPDLELNVS